MHENSIITLRGDSNGRVSIWKLAPQQDQQIDWMLQFSEEIPVGKPTGLILNLEGGTEGRFVIVKPFVFEMLTRFLKYMQ